MTDEYNVVDYFCNINNNVDLILVRFCALTSVTIYITRSYINLTDNELFWHNVCVS